MGENKVELVKARLLGYINVFNGLTNHINVIGNGIKSIEDTMSKTEKFETAYSNDILKAYSLSQDFEILTRDSEKYLLKIATYLDILNDIGEEFTTNDETVQKTVDTAKTYTTDKTAFHFTMIEGKVVPVNEKLHKSIKDVLSQATSVSGAMEKLYETVKNNLPQG